MRACTECGSVNPVEARRCLVCDDPLPAAVEDLIDGRYRTIKELGRGANGVVYAALDVALKRQVALKFLAPKLTQKPRALKRFQREAVALASIRSDHVAQVFSFGIEQSAFFFSMELVLGRSCKRIIQQQADNQEWIPVHRALVILIEMARGLAAVHSAGIVHRDVKPDNAVVEQGTGRTVLVDFGLAVTGDEPGDHAVVGSPAYMAPEQIRGTSRISARTDVYGLACAGFHLLTNRLVFQTDDVKAMLSLQLNEAPPRLSSCRPELEPLDEVFLRALSKDPEDRFSNCAEMTSALELAGAPWLKPSLPTAPSGEFEEPVAARILVVDDDDEFAKLSVRASQIAFFGTSSKVARARTGEEALLNAARKPPQLVLLDYDLPGMNGVEMLSRLRSLPGAKKARVVVISAKAGDAARWRFDALGVDGFLRKPITMKELVDVIQALGRARGWIAVDEADDA
ncbi:MAG: protein kinase [Sandaracinaceae bacterium]|nr:protein kinase [Sandaracinaceae bacterium]